MPPVAQTESDFETSNLENHMSAVYISDQERYSGIPSAATVGAAYSILCRDGIVVLENAVDVAHCDALHKQLSSEIPELVKDPNTNWNQGRDKGNISQAPPLTPDLMFADIWANPFATAVISAILGPRPRVGYVNGNTALPNTHGRQNVHADLKGIYGKHAFAMVANYYLTDTDKSNGATEVWLRSHADTHIGLHESPDRAWIDPIHYLNRAKSSGFPPIRPSVKKGSVVIRDLRLWHAGRDNPSDEPRIMLAFVHFPWWFQNHLRVTLPESTRPFFESFSDRLEYQTNFVDGSVDHKAVKFDPTFTSTNKAYNETISHPIQTQEGKSQAGERTKIHG